MPYTAAYTRPYAKQFTRSYAGLGLGDTFSLASLNPALWLDAAYGVSTGGSRKFTSLDKAHLEVANNAGLQTGNVDFWVAGWVNLATKTAFRPIIIKAGNDVPSVEYQLDYSNTTDRFRLTIGNGSTTQTVEANAFGSPTVGTWYFVLGWHDSVNNTLNVSVNTTATQVAATINPAVTTQEVHIGAHANILSSPRYMDGRISRAAFGKNPPGGIAAVISALSTSLYNAGNGKSRGDVTDAEATAWGLVSYWNLNENGGTAYDAHGTNDLGESLSELIANTGFETWTTSTDAASWSEQILGTSTVNQETTSPIAGISSCRLDIDASNSQALVYQNILTSGNRYTISAYCKSGSGTPSFHFYYGGKSIVSVSTVAEASQKIVVATTNTFGLSNESAAANSLYFDTVSVKATSIPGADGPGNSTGIADGDPVVSWLSRDSGSKTATQTTSAARTVYKTGVINGQPVIRFDGVDDFLNLPDLSALTEGEVFIVLDLVADPPVASKSGLWDIGADAASHYPYSDGVIYDSFGTSARKTVGNPSSSLALPRIYNVASKSGEWTARLDGSQLFTTAVNTPLFKSSPLLGKDLTGTALLEGDVAVMVLFDYVLTPAQRTKVNTYLSNRYGIALA